jgi:DNA-binding transcriptional MerR regulator
MKTKTLTIHEVGQKLGLTTHTLRFWEKELGGLIVPLRTKGGQRRYTPEHLFVIGEIQRMKSLGLSLTSIKDKLNNSNGSPVTDSGTSQVDLLADRIADLVRSALYQFFEGKVAKE